MATPHVAGAVALLLQRRNVGKAVAVIVSQQPHQTRAARRIGDGEPEAPTFPSIGLNPVYLKAVMEGMSMVITTIPLLFPVVKALGYDPIWFGVVITMLVEIAMISPPDGTVLYVLQGMRRQPGPITDVFMGVLPFMAVYMLAIGILMVFPAIALWLPAAVM